MEGGSVSYSWRDVALAAILAANKSDASTFSLDSDDERQKRRERMAAVAEGRAAKRIREEEGEGVVGAEQANGTSPDNTTKEEANGDDENRSQVEDKNTKADDCSADHDGESKREDQTNTTAEDQQTAEKEKDTGYRERHAKAIAKILAKKNEKKVETDLFGLPLE